MKEKFKYILTIIITLIVGVIGTIVTLKHYDLLGKPVIEKTVSNITLTESDTIKPAIDKVYDSQVYIESYKNNRQTGSGSGFVYKKDDKYGYILTNHHVIDGASSIQTTNMQGQTVTAKVLGSDEYTDVAVLRVEASAVLSVAELGKSENSNIGDTIFAVGSPMGKEYIGSVTKGIISGKNRSVTVNSTNNPSTQYVVEVIQVDAALNPGNSGGALVNINGEVIGITSMKLVEDEIEGMGFAIPIELVESILDKLENGKKIERPVLGVSLLDVDNKYVLYVNGITLESSIDSGVVVVEVEKSSPAGKASLKKGDVILELNNEKVLDVAYFRSLLYKYNVGDTITLKVYRDNSILDLKVKLDVSLLNS